MKIIFTSDNHIFFNDQYKNVCEMIERIQTEKPDVVCILGDIGEILMSGNISENKTLLKLFSFTPTLFVAGNHDLYCEVPLPPSIALKRFVKTMPFGIPLQQIWKDSDTIFLLEDCLFLGVIGFPDFGSPKALSTPFYYNHRSPTIDGKYIDLSKGWLYYTKSMLKAFEHKLRLLQYIQCSKVIINTHYPIFETQYKFNPNDDVSYYFYCYQLGTIIEKVAEKYPDKQFYCVAGHAHKFNRGEWITHDWLPSKNVTSCGIVTDYGEQKFVLLIV